MNKVCFFISFKFLYIIGFSSNLFSQTLINQGATIRTFPGSTVRVSGSVLNNTSGQIYVNGDGSVTSAQWYVSQDIQNQSIISADGHIHLNRHWINNGTYNFGVSTVFLEGGNQNLAGTTATTFYNLTLASSGSGVKTQFINKSCTNILELNNQHLNTDIFTFFVLNTSLGAITRDFTTNTSGFVSSANGGYLSRATNSTGTYLFPTGSTANNSLNTPGSGTIRYRPVEVVPNSNSLSSYTARLANLDASTTTENVGTGYNLNSKENLICTANSLFFHQINRSAGIAPADIKVYYVPLSDGIWQGLARWNLPSIDDTWRAISGSSTSPSASPFSVALKTAWNNFTANPYILYNGLSVIANCGGPVCPGITSPAHVLSSTVSPPGTYNYSWSSNPAGFTSSAANPSITPTPSTTTTYTVSISNTTDNCQAVDSCTLIVLSAPIPPTVITTAGTCAAVGTATVSNYDNTLTYTFSPSGPSVGAAGAISGVTPGTSYTVTSTNASSCTATSSSFTVPTQLAVPTAPTVGNITQPTCVSPTASVEFSDLPNTGSWTIVGVPSGSLTGTGTIGTITGLTAGTSYIFTVTNENGCQSSATSNILINSVPILPTASINYTGSPWCITSGLQSVSQTGTTGGTYTSSPSGLNINPITGQISPSTSSAGIYTVTYSFSDLGCINSSSTTVTISPTENPIFTQLAPICSGGLINLPTTSTNNISGTWSPAINNTQTTIYTFTPTSGQCAVSTTMNVTVNSPTLATFTQVGEICAGGLITLPAISENGFSGTWSPPINSNATTNYTFTPSSGQCATNASMTVSVSPITVPTFSPVSPICYGEPLSGLPTTSTNGISGSWSPAVNNLATTTYTFNPSPIPGPDCDQAVLICDPNQLITVSSLSGAGNNDEEPEAGSCMDVPGPNEQNSAWYIFNAATSGNLTFDIIPNLPNDDIDFILYQLNSDNPCGPRTVIRCNSSSCLSSTGATGLSMTDTDLIENPNCDPGENAYCQFVQTTAGSKYALLINNCNTNQGFTLQFNTGIPNPVTFGQPSSTSTFYNATNCIGQCATTASMTVTVNPAYNIVIDTSFCTNNLPVLWQGQTINSSGNFTANLIASNGCDSTVTLNVILNSMSATLGGQTNISCFGGNNGSVSIMPSGGVGPYAISPIQTNLTAGNYTFIVTDNDGCEASVTTEILEPSSSISSAISGQTNVSCFGLGDGSVTLSITGGTAPYITSPNTINLTAGAQTFTTTDNNGCSVQTNATILEPNQIITSTIIGNVVCPNGTGGIDLTITGGISPYSVLWDNGILSEDLTNIPVGAYSAQITDANGCLANVNALVYQSLANQPTITNITGTSELSCITQGVIYAVSNGNTILWSGGTSPNAVTNTFTTPGQYTLTVTDSNACIYQFTVNITEDVTPPIITISNNTGVTHLNCINNQISVVANGAVNYTWDNGLPATPSQILIQAGTYTVTGIDSNGCVSTSVIIITSDFTQPTASVVNNSSGSILNCNLSQISLSANGGDTYSWNNNLGTNSNVTINSPGTYTVTITGINGCQDSDSIIITQAPIATVSLNLPISICSGSSGILTAIGTPAGGSYSWSCSNATSSSISLTPTTNGICQVVYYDTFNCPSNTASTTITVIQTPLVNVSGTPTICSGNAASITAVASLPGGTFSWSPAAPPTATIAVTPLVTTTYSATYTLNGCSSSPVGYTVNVDQTPAVTSTSVGICTGGSTTLVASADISGGTYSWNTTPPQSTSTILVQPAATTSYVVTYTAPNNCIATSTSQVTVTDMPSVQLDDISVCEGEMGTLTAIPSVPGGIFTWTPGGVGGPTLEVNVLSSTQYSVVYTLNDCASPADNAIVSVVNNPSVIAPDVTICLGQSATLNATGSPLGGTYQWSTSESNSSILVDPSVNTDYTVTYYLNGCPSPTETVSVTVESIPAVTFDVDVTEGCLPLTVNFTNTTPNATNCTWLFSNGFSIDGCEPFSYTFQEAGCFDISLITSSQNGCSNTTTMNELICVEANPTADFSLSTNTIGEGNNTVQIENTSTGGVEYIWNYGDQTTDSLLFNPGSHTYTGNASSYVISLVAISAYGCIDSTSQLITVSDEIVIYAPNTFIPDNDGLNDIWIPIISAGLVSDSYELDIYNRWGEKIFSTKDYLQGWDGTYLGNKVQDGIYSYIIRLRDTKTKYNQIYTGHITLIR